MITLFLIQTQGSLLLGTKPSNDKPDNRGSKTKEMHIKTKEYHEANPTLTYRECFVKVSKNQV